MEGEKIFAKKMTDKRFVPQNLQTAHAVLHPKKKEKKIKSKSGQKI